MRILILIFAILSMLTSCSTEPDKRTFENPPSWTSYQKGEASWYSVKTNGGRHTASGQNLSDNSYTAAHKTLPFGTRVMVTNLRNGKSVIVSINNRGPFIKGRIIDVTIGVASELDFKSRGVTQVELKILK